MIIDIILAIIMYMKRKCIVYNIYIEPIII